MKDTAGLWAILILAMVGIAMYNMTEGFPSFSLFLSQNGF